MERAHNGSVGGERELHLVGTSAPSSAAESEGSARLYIIILLSFYGVFLAAIAVGYLRSKQREKRRTNVFTRLLHEEEQQKWGANLKKDSCASLTFPPTTFFSHLGGGPDSARVNVVPIVAPHESRVLAPVPVPVPPSPLACALCSVEQSSETSLCSSADGCARLAIEEEGDSGTGEGEGPEDPVKGGGHEDSSDGSAENLKESSLSSS
ncbi:potassium voltage-gated channel subfamily E member 4 [Engraulis encrasicolus]|uniref:potassium voltage-gated channel subfamily E member 4 n=1 Tax=Engraulis encrasicolus TaxID=184585 RepID=UPI002FD00203